MKKKIPNTPKQSTIVETYETEIEYDCPVRGKVKQKVKVKRLQPVDQSTAANDVLPNKSISDKLDLEYSGLMMEDDSIKDEEEV